MSWLKQNWFKVSWLLIVLFLILVIKEYLDNKLYIEAQTKIEECYYHRDEVNQKYNLAGGGSGCAAIGEYLIR